jgi:hypothetical protein
MKFLSHTFLILLLSIALVSGNSSIQKIDGIFITDGRESPDVPESPPITDSICLVYSGIDYGDDFNSPQAYPHAKHITNVEVGSYYFPIVTWETGDSWSQQSLFSYWDDLFKFWSYPDSFTTNEGQDTGRPAICSDSNGSLHFAWHQLGSPDGYEIFYTRAFLDTSSGVITYNVERPATMISITNGEQDHFPSMAIYGDTLIMIVWGWGGSGADHAIGYNYSTDGGDTWNGAEIAYEHGSVFPGSWILVNVEADPISGNMWVAVCFDMSGDGSMDLLALEWDAPTDTWTIETVANAPSMHPYACPVVAVDFNGIPHIVFQENLNTTGGSSGLSGWNECGPAGTLFYTHRQGGSWSTPQKIEIPDLPCVQCNYCAGYPSVGIANDNTIYFSNTYPDSASVDTGSYLPFNVHYSEISPYTGAVNYGGKISNLPWGSATCAIFSHITYNVPADGPGITWCQMEAATPPTDAYYCHKDTILGIVESDDISVPSPVTLYQNYPNPASSKTMIRFTVPDNRNVRLDIYDISGRLVRTLANGIPGAGSYFSVWDGKDVSGKEVPAGVYLYTLKAGSYTQTRKLLLIH